MHRARGRFFVEAISDLRQAAADRRAGGGGGDGNERGHEMQMQS